MKRSIEQGTTLADPSVVKVERCQLALGHGAWQFAEQHHADIRRHWVDRVRQNPRMFNGVIHIMTDHSVERDVFSAQFARTDFASYLYWREQGFADPSVCDCFTSVLICGDRGDVLVARAADHTLNAGALVAPGGMIDERDVASDGTIDAFQYGLRELGEETGLHADDIAATRGIYVSRDAALIGLIVVCEVRLSDASVLARVHDHNSRLDEVELLDPQWVNPGDEASLSKMPTYLAQALRVQATTVQSQ